MTVYVVQNLELGWDNVVGVYSSLEAVAYHQDLDYDIIISDPDSIRPLYIYEYEVENSS